MGVRNRPSVSVQVGGSPNQGKNYGDAELEDTVVGSVVTVEIIVDYICSNQYGCGVELYSDIRDLLERSPPPTKIVTLSSNLPSILPP